MKSSDIALVVCVALVTVIGTFTLLNGVFKGNQDVGEVVQYSTLESGAVVMPDPDFFNAYAKNPTVEIIIGKCNKLTEFYDEELKRCVPISTNDDEEKEDEYVKDEDKKDEDKKKNEEGGDQSQRH